MGGTAHVVVEDAQLVEFPLRGEWRALNTPGHRVPSHGTNYFGQRFAYDFVRMDPDGLRYQAGSMWRHLVLGAPASTFYCWDEPVLAAFEGEVVGVGDGWPDRDPVRIVTELLRVMVRQPAPRGRDYRPLTGNYVFVEGNPGVAVYAHLRNGSVAARVGQRVTTGERIGTVGNSGNSTMPHLHFHVMDGRDPFVASGVACAFRSYERFVDGRWEIVRNGIPARDERIRAT